MRIALIGFGKMGQEVYKLALDQVVTIISPNHPKADFIEISEKSLENVDVCIDFSNPKYVYNNLKKIISLKKKCVVGTTGWFQHLPEIEKLVLKNNTALLYGANFSVGVYLYKKIVDYSSQLLSKFDQYYFEIEETHHLEKKDSPSGTAIELKELLQNPNSKITSFRKEAAIGKHSVIINSNVDKIELSHKALDRKSFAQGALFAAEFIKNKVGVCSFNDAMHKHLQEEKSKC